MVKPLHFGGSKATLGVNCLLQKACDSDEFPPVGHRKMVVFRKGNPPQNPVNLGVGIIEKIAQISPCMAD